MEDGVTFIIPHGFGVKTFSKRAILRIAMLLRDSQVAKEIRTHLLNVFEAHEEETVASNLTKYSCGSVWHWDKDDFNLSSGRYVIVISNDNEYVDGSFVKVTALTITKTQRGWETETPIVVKDGVQSYIDGGEIHTIPKCKLSSFHGYAPDEMILVIKKKLMKKLGLTNTHIDELNCLIDIKQKYKNMK